MGKSITQAAFDSFVDERTSGEPFRHALIGIGLDARDADRASDIHISDLVAKDVCKLVEQTLAKNENISPLNLSDLLAANIAALLKPFMVEGRGPISMLDVVNLGLTENVDIKRFLKIHGADLDNPRDLEYVNGVFREAIAFFDKVIAREPKEKINPSLKHTGNPDGISRIFQTAAGKHQRQLVPEACGLLRIAAVIDFLNRDPLLSVLPEAQAELEKIKAKYFSTIDGETTFNTRRSGEIPMEIKKCELRTKERERMIVKLLHKPQNSTQEVVDHIGMRVTTKSASDALRFIYLAFFKPDTAIFPGMTIRTNETKQLLLEETVLMKALQSPRKAAKLVKELAITTINHDELISNGEQECANKHSSQKYKAIHITFDLPLVGKNGQRVHFPVEIQIVDEASREVNETEAPHGEYRKRQTAAVSRRLMDNNLLTKFAKTRVKDEE